MPILPSLPPSCAGRPRPDDIWHLEEVFIQIAIACCTISGGQSTSTGPYWTSSYRSAAVGRLLNASSSICYKSRNANPDGSSLMAYAVTALLPMRGTYSPRACG